MPPSTHKAQAEVRAREWRLSEAAQTGTRVAAVASGIGLATVVVAASLALRSAELSWLGSAGLGFSLYFAFAVAARKTKKVKPPSRSPRKLFQQRGGFATLRAETQVAKDEQQLRQAAPVVEPPAQQEKLQFRAPRLNDNDLWFFGDKDAARRSIAADAGRAAFVAAELAARSGQERAQVTALLRSFEPRVRDEYRVLRFLVGAEWDSAKAAKLLQADVEFREAGPLMGLVPDEQLVPFSRLNAADHFPTMQASDLSFEGAACWRIVANVGRQKEPVIFIRSARYLPIGDGCKEYMCYSNLMYALAGRFYHGTTQQSIVIMDYADWGPIDNFSATEILKLLVCLQEHYPDHAKKIYFVNVPWVFGFTWNIVRPWLAAGLVARIQFCEDVREVHELISPTMLEVSMGGSMPDGQGIWRDRAPAAEYAGSEELLAGRGIGESGAPDLPRPLAREQLSGRGGVNRY